MVGRARRHAKGFLNLAIAWAFPIRVLLRALEESNWNVSGAARALGMGRTNLHKRIRALGLSRGK